MVGFMRKGSNKEVKEDKKYRQDAEINLNAEPKNNKEKELQRRKEKEEELKNKDKVKELEEKVKESKEEFEDIPDSDDSRMGDEVEKVLIKSPLGPYITGEDVTDISFNGWDLYVQDSTGLHKVEDSGISGADIQKLGRQIANISNKTFNPIEPILDTAIGRYRLNFMHSSVSPFGATTAIRVSKPSLAIRDVSKLANGSIIQLLNLCMKVGENMIISGQTGSGKTEFQKFLVGFIPDNKKITLMEDTPDSHLKTIYRNKDINSWVTKKGGDNDAGLVDFTDLLKSALRNNPDWAIISETRGAEAKYMIDAAQTDHSVITTLHAAGAAMIPSRLISMVSQGSKDFNEVLLGSDITDVIKIGVHMQLDRSNKKMNRFVREVVEYTGYSEKGVQYNYIYRVVNDYNEETGAYDTKIETGPVSKGFVDKLKLNRLYHKLPVYHHPDCYDESGRFDEEKAKKIYENSNKGASFQPEDNVSTTTINRIKRR